MQNKINGKLHAIVKAYVNKQEVKIQKISMAMPSIFLFPRIWRNLDTNTTYKLLSPEISFQVRSIQCMQRLAKKAGNGSSLHDITPAKAGARPQSQLVVTSQKLIKSLERLGQ